MRAIECPCDQPKAPLTLVTGAPPVFGSLGQREVAIAVHYSGVNRADLSQRAGKYPPPPGASPLLGLEVSGVVTAVGDATTKFRVGDRVMALLAGGGYADEAVVDERLCLPVPESLSLEEAAGVPEAFLTAHHNIFTIGGLLSGESVLVHAGASGVGTAALQLVRGYASQVFATVGTKKKAEPVEALGAHVLVRSEGDFGEALLQQLPEGCNVILDVGGGSNLESNIRALADEGRLVCIGLLGEPVGKLDVSKVLRKRLRIIGSTLRGLPMERKAAIVERFRVQFYAALEERTLLPLIDSVYAADAVAQAHERMAANENIGKILLHWGRREP